MLIIRKIRSLLLLAILPAVLSMAPAMGQDPIYPGMTTDLGIEPIPGATYYWEIFCDSTVNFATASPDCGTKTEFVNGNDMSTVQVKWNEKGTYFFKIFVTNADGCTNFKIGKIKVEESLPTAVLEVNPDSVCIGDWAELVVNFTGIKPWSFVLESSDGVNITTTTYDNISDSTYIIPVGPTVTTTYRVISVTDKYGSNSEPSESVILEIMPLPNRSRIYLKPE